MLMMGYFFDEFGVEIDHLVCSQFSAIAFLEDVALLFAVVKFTAGHIEREVDVFPSLVSGGFDGGEDAFERVFGALERRRKAAFITHGGGEAALFEHAFERVKNFGDCAESFAESRQAGGHHHKFLKINRRITVRAAVDDIGHRHWQHLGVRPAEVFIKRLAQRIGRGFGGGEGHGEHSIGAELAFVGGAVHGDHGVVDAHLISGIASEQFGQDFGLNIFDRFLHALAAVAFLDAIAQLDSFVFAGAGTAGHGGAAHCAAVENDIGFDGWVATGIENLAGLNINNGRHVFENGCAMIAAENGVVKVIAGER